MSSVFLEASFSALGAPRDCLAPRVERLVRAETPERAAVRAPERALPFGAEVSLRRLLSTRRVDR